MAVTVKHPFVSTVPDAADTSLVRPSNWNADHTITGLGTAAELNAGVANGVATLDGGGTVPISQLPAAVLGALSYQGTWNASTNTPTLTSSVGTKGYYYVVNVAGSTDLDGITDWKVGDWAVYNGTAWQKIDNTDAVTSVNGYTGTVVLTQPDIAGTANAPTNTNITSMTGVTGGISTPDYIAFDTTYATTLTAGQLGWDGNNTLGIGMAGGNVIQHIGEDQFFYAKASSTITKGQVIMFTGAVGASGVPTGAPATGITDGTYIMGIAAESIATNGFGLIQCFGTLRNTNTSGYADGDILWYDPSVTGGLTKTKPSAPNVKVQMAAVINGGSSGGGTILIRINAGSTLGGTDSNAQITSPTNGQIITYDGAGTYFKNTSIASGTGISVSAATDGTLTITNTAPSSGGTVTSVSGTAPIASSGGNTPTISISQASTSTNGYLSSTDWNTFNNKQPAGSYLTTVTADAPLSGSGTSASHLVISQATTSTNGYLSSTDWNTFNNKQPAGTYVTSVAATSPVTSSGGTTPTIAMPAANGSTNGYLTSTDWTTFNNKGSGTVTSVTGTAPIVSSGGTTPAISIPAASGSVNGYLTSTDWTTFNSKAAAFTYTSTYIPYGQGTTTPNQSSSLTFDGTIQLAPIQGASNGIVVNNCTIATTYSIPSGYSATSAGPITINSGVTVTVPTGGKWVVL